MTTPRPCLKSMLRFFWGAIVLIVMNTSLHGFFIAQALGSAEAAPPDIIAHAPSAGPSPAHLPPPLPFRPPSYSVCPPVPAGFEFLEGMNIPDEDYEFSCLRGVDATTWSVESQAAQCAADLDCAGFNVDGTGSCFNNLRDGLVRVSSGVACWGLYRKMPGGSIGAPNPISLPLPTPLPPAPPPLLTCPTIPYYTFKPNVLMVGGLLYGGAYPGGLFDAAAGCNVMTPNCEGFDTSSRLAYGWAALVAVPDVGASTCVGVYVKMPAITPPSPPPSPPVPPNIPQTYSVCDPLPRGFDFISGYEPITGDLSCAPNDGASSGEATWSVASRAEQCLAMHACMGFTVGLSGSCLKKDSAKLEHAGPGDGCWGFYRRKVPYAYYSKVPDLPWPPQSPSAPSAPPRPSRCPEFAGFQFWEHQMASGPPLTHVKPGDLTNARDQCEIADTCLAFTTDAVLVRELSHMVDTNGSADGSCQGTFVKLSAVPSPYLYPVCAPVPPGFKFEMGADRADASYSCIRGKEASTWSVAGQADLCMADRRCVAFSVDDLGSCLIDNVVWLDGMPIDGVTCYGTYLRLSPAVDGAPLTPFPPRMPSLPPAPPPLLSCPRLPGFTIRYGMMMVNATIFGGVKPGGLYDAALACAAISTCTGFDTDSVLAASFTLALDPSWDDPLDGCRGVYTLGEELSPPNPPATPQPPPPPPFDVCADVPESFTFTPGMDYNGGDFECLHYVVGPPWSVASRAAACLAHDDCTAFNTNAEGSCLKSGNAPLYQAWDGVPCYGIYVRTGFCKPTTPLPVTSVTDLEHVDVYENKVVDEVIKYDPRGKGWFPKYRGRYRVRFTFARTVTIGALATRYRDDVHAPTGFALYSLLPVRAFINSTSAKNATTATWTTELTTPHTADSIDVEIKEATAGNAIAIDSMTFFCSPGTPSLPQPPPSPPQPPPVPPSAACTELDGYTFIPNIGQTKSITGSYLNTVLPGGLAAAKIVCDTYNSYMRCDGFDSATQLGFGFTLDALVAAPAACQGMYIRQDRMTDYQDQLAALHAGLPPPSQAPAPLQPLPPAAPPPGAACPTFAGYELRWLMVMQNATVLAVVPGSLADGAAACSQAAGCAGFSSENRIASNFALVAYDGPSPLGCLGVFVKVAAGPPPPDVLSPSSPSPLEAPPTQETLPLRPPPASPSPSPSPLQSTSGGSSSSSAVFPGWAIGVVIGGVLGIIALTVAATVGVLACRQRRRRHDLCSGAGGPAKLSAISIHPNASSMVQLLLDDDKIPPIAKALNPSAMELLGAAPIPSARSQDAVEAPGAAVSAMWQSRDASDGRSLADAKIVIRHGDSFESPGEGSSMMLDMLPQRKSSLDAYDPQLMKAHIIHQHSQLKDEQLELYEVLGRGGSGIVYRANWKGLPVAAKLMIVHEEAEEAARRQMLEATMSTGLYHSNIVNTYVCDLKRLGDPEQHAKRTLDPLASTWQMVILQELCLGGSLKQLIGTGVLSLRIGSDDVLRVKLAHVLQLAVDIVTGLEHLHSKNIVHSDLTPSNVLLQDAGPVPRPLGLQWVAKVADFGLSIVFDEDKTHASQVFAGTPHYIAPETQAGGIISKQSDVFTLGILLYELAAGALSANQPSLQQHGATAATAGAVAAAAAPPHAVGQPPSTAAAAIADSHNDVQLASTSSSTVRSPADLSVENVMGLPDASALIQTPNAHSRKPPPPAVAAAPPPAAAKDSLQYGGIDGHFNTSGSQHNYSSSSSDGSFGKVPFCGGAPVDGATARRPFNFSNASSCGTVAGADSGSSVAQVEGQIDTALLTHSADEEREGNGLVAGGRGRLGAARALPPLPRACPPTYRSLVAQCLSQTPQRRPALATVRQCLSHLLEKHVAAMPE